MRAFLVTITVVAVVLILVGVLLRAVRWLLILGLAALVVAIVMGALRWPTRTYDK